MDTNILLPILFCSQEGNGLWQSTVCKHTTDRPYEGRSYCNASTAAEEEWEDKINIFNEVGELLKTEKVARSTTNSTREIVKSHQVSNHEPVNP
jgi:hypothetical protein